MTLMLVDANNLYYRSWFGSRNGSHMEANGVNTGPLVIFMATLSRLIREHSPSHVAVVWDGGKSEFRTQVRPEYKANRQEQLDHAESVYNGRVLIQKFLAICAIQQVAREGFEADDVIAGFWSDAEQDIVIVSNDKDLTQLCGSNPKGHLTSVIRLSSSETGTDLWHEEEVEAHYGCTPKQLPLLMALMGDKSDNISGIPGIGPKKGLKILQESNFNTIEVLSHPKVEEHADLVRSNLALVTLRSPLGGMNLNPILEFDPVNPTDAEDWEYLLTFLTDHELHQIHDKMIENSYWVRPPNAFY
jgi:DNA polymerase-1